MPEKPSNPSPSNDDWDDDVSADESAPTPPNVEEPQGETSPACAVPREQAEAPVQMVRKKRRRSKSENESKDEDTWGAATKGRKRSSSGVIWLVVSAVGLFLLGGLGFVAVNYLGGDKEKADGIINVADLAVFENDSDELSRAEEIAKVAEERRDAAQDPADKAWFDVRAGRLTSIFSSIIKEIREAPAGDTAALRKYLRHPESSLELLKTRDDIFAPAPVLDRLDAWQLAVNDYHAQAHAVFSGKRIDGTPFEYFFIATESGPLMDWEASAAYSVIPIPELIARRPSGEHEIRARVRKGNVYLEGYNDAEWSSWELLTADSQQSLWALVPKDGDIDRTFRDWLNYGQFILELKEEELATVKVRAAGSGRFPRLFEVTELVNRGWVKP